MAVLGMETMLVSVLDGNQKFVLAASGFLTPGMSLDPPAICHWALVPSLHQMVVVEDTLKDARQAALLHQMLTTIDIRTGQIKLAGVRLQDKSASLLIADASAGP